MFQLYDNTNYYVIFKGPYLNQYFFCQQEDNNEKLYNTIKFELSELNLLPETI